MITRLFIFLIINFGALAIGSMSTSAGVFDTWYMQLNKAPWTPPGWVFGAAWTVIMICFSFYMAKAWDAVSNRNTLIILYILQLILNIGWNPIFFNLQYVILGLIVISALTILIAYIMRRFRKPLGSYTYLLLPYLIWLIIATSLNAYILMYN